MALERRLRRILYRFNCPSPDVLRDYHWGYLPPDKHQQVEAHLDVCLHCAAELADLAKFVTTEQAETTSTLLARARRAAAQARLIVARLVSPARSPVPVLRGQTREVLLFEAGTLALSVNVQLEDTGTYTLFGQILSPEPTDFSDGYVRLTASEEDKRPVQAALDANGGFVVPDLHPATYQLIVGLRDTRIVVPDLKLQTGP